MPEEQANSGQKPGQSTDKSPELGQGIGTEQNKSESSHTEQPKYDPITQQKLETIRKIIEMGEGSSEPKLGPGVEIIHNDSPPQPVKPIEPSHTENSQPEKVQQPSSETPNQKKNFFMHLKGSLSKINFKHFEPFKKTIGIALIIIIVLIVAFKLNSITGKVIDETLIEEPETETEFKASLNDKLFGDTSDTKTSKTIAEETQEGTEEELVKKPSKSLISTIELEREDENGIINETPKQDLEEKTTENNSSESGIATQIMDYFKSKVDSSVSSVSSLFS